MCRGAARSLLAYLAGVEMTGHATLAKLIFGAQDCACWRFGLPKGRLISMI
jgi:hypothetical protein